MHTAIIVHGKPSKDTYNNSEHPSASNSLWLPWIQQQLLQRGIAAQTPEMLNAYQPDYNIWKHTFEQFTLNTNTLLVGHSCGGGFLVQWLSEHPDVQVGHVFLVAPAFGDSLTPSAPYDEPLLGGFFDFTPDPLLVERTAGLHVLYTDNDSLRVDDTISLLKQTYDRANFHLFPGYGHFTKGADGTLLQFPELLAAIDEILVVS